MCNIFCQQVHTVTGTLVVFSSLKNFIPQLHKYSVVYPIRQSLFSDAWLPIGAKNMKGGGGGLFKIGLGGLSQYMGGRMGGLKTSLLKSR